MGPGIVLRAAGGPGLPCAPGTRPQGAGIEEGETACPQLAGRISRLSVGLARWQEPCGGAGRVGAAGGRARGPVRGREEECGHPVTSTGSPFC